MKTLGILGGMSAESTVEYYNRINRGVNQALGGHEHPRMFVYSANLGEVFGWLEGKDLAPLGDHLGEAAVQLERGGADFMIMACNTAHLVAPSIEERLGIPFVHIADALAEELQRASVQRVGLLGISMTVEAPFFRERLGERYGIEVLTPGAEDKAEVDRVIRDELCFHRLEEASRESLTAIVRRLGEQGAEAVALVCTELSLLLPGDHVAGLRSFDSMAIHVAQAVEFALEERSLDTVGELAA